MTPPEMTQPEQEQIDRDLPCRSCGYNLRGLPRAGNCPECGQPVVRSENVPSIMSADPAWLRGIERGCGVLLAWIGLNAVLLVMAAMEIWFDWIGFVGLSYTICAVTVTAISILMCWGVWELTRSDPWYPVGPSQRPIIRAMIMAGAGMVITAVWVRQVTHLVVYGSILWVVGYLALLDYLGKLVAGTNDLGLAGRVQRCLDLALIAIILTVLIIPFLIMPQLDTRYDMLFPLVLIATIALVLVILPLNAGTFVLLLLKLRRRMRFIRLFIAGDSFASGSDRLVGSGGTEAANAAAGQRDRRG